MFLAFLAHARHTVLCRILRRMLLGMLGIMLRYRCKLCYMSRCMLHCTFRVHCCIIFLSSCGRGVLPCGRMFGRLGLVKHSKTHLKKIVSELGIASLVHMAWQATWPGGTLEHMA